jgi:hypothetical protein
MRVCVHVFMYLPAFLFPGMLLLPYPGQQLSDLIPCHSRQLRHQPNNGQPGVDFPSLPRSDYREFFVSHYSWIGRELPIMALVQV